MFNRFKSTFYILNMHQKKYLGLKTSSHKMIPLESHKLSIISLCFEVYTSRMSEELI